VAAGHEAVLWWRHGHAESWTGNIVDRVRQAEVLVARLGRKLVLKRVEVIILAFKVFFLLVVAQRLAVSAGLVCATMSDELISMWFIIGCQHGYSLGKVV
jgi:hypothetical protein